MNANQAIPRSVIARVLSMLKSGCHVSPPRPASVRARFGQKVRSIAQTHAGLTRTPILASRRRKGIMTTP